MLTIRRSDMTYRTALWLINQDRDISGMCLVEFSDGAVTLPVRPVILMLPFWEVYVRMDIPVTMKQIFFTGPPFHKSLYSKVLQQVYTDCFAEEGGKEYFHRLKVCLWDAINAVNDFGTHELLEYVCGMSIIDFAELYHDPKIRSIVQVDVREEQGPMAIKKKFIQGQKDLYDALSREDYIENNGLYPFTSVKAIKPSQLFQVMGNYGLRTEINDRVFRRPVYGNSLNGLRDFADMVLENSASRKNVYYSHDAIRLSQYFNREMSLASMSIARLYPGWCGHDVQLPFQYTQRLVPAMLGKYFYLPDDRMRTLRVLTEDNVRDYVGKPIMMYSPFTCGHTDGICERCLGMIARNHTDGINVGMTATSNLVSEIAQLILSIKHDDQAIPVVYSIPDGANEWFKMDPSGIKFQSSVSKIAKYLELGIFFEDIICSTGDLEHIANDMNVPENKYSKIKSVLIRDTRNDTSLELIMKSDDMVPFLTTEFLVHLRENLGTSVRNEQDVLWVGVEGLYKEGNPIMRSIVTNNSMMVYVTHLTDIFKKQHLSKYHDASKALMDISEMVFERVTNANIFQLEIMMRAHMVSGSDNFSIPVVNDVRNVTFARTKDVISQRTISSQLAHEGHNKHFADARTFTTLKDQNVLDRFVGV